MGDLRPFPLKEIKEEFNLAYYIETGTGTGFCLDIALQNDFEKYYSIEIFDQIYQKAEIKYKNIDNLILINDSSENGLNKILNEINKPSLFFLDAHFPGADFGFTSYDSTKEKELRIPLEDEIKILKKYSIINQSYIIIDDLRIYEDGPFEGGNWSERKKLGGEGISFIYDNFLESHLIEKNYKDQGYIILRPKI